MLERLLIFAGVIVRRSSHDWGCFEIVFCWRGRSLPLKTGRAPWIGRRFLTVFQRPDEIDQGQDISDPKYRSTGARKDVVNLKLGRISMVPARHPQIAD